ncbi:Predicted arabinose efflux permease, MFS family [Actinokineospora iranica]|uniref:Predicted arabinose efflux permease, MFS family n=2 Tax=Actinokineospora iranica TaxID=1271860 RepID=A0A1G6Y5P5_9PSEU|nr:Predicted arabinose efflux permease, MFS family [Actinokineospora iranica]
MLGLPGMRTLMILMLFARLPASAAGMVLTLHVAVGMKRGYGAAGLVGGVATVGIALGAPVMGRVVDRYGLRPMLVLTTVGEAAFWLTARHMSYPVLLACAFAGGFLVLPAMSIGRQAIAALVPVDLRRTAYSLDSVSVELTYMVGPAMAVLLATQVSTGVATIGVGGTVVAAGVALFVVNPRVRAAHEQAHGSERIPRREWLTARMVGVYAVGAGAVFVLAGTDVTMVAALRAADQLDWTGAVVAVICVASAAGGLVHGAVQRSLPQVTLMALLGLLVIPVGLFAGQWWMLALALVPSSAMCAPTVAATGEEVSRLAPPSMRGEATGLQSSAFTLGAATGSPLVGFVVDHSSAAWGFAVAGIGGVLVAGAAWALGAGRTARTPISAGSPS